MHAIVLLRPNESIGQITSNVERPPRPSSNADSYEGNPFRAISSICSQNGADGISDIEGKAARVAASKRGRERVSNAGFKRRLRGRKRRMTPKSYVGNPFFAMNCI
jgi:hypothetical protein